MAYKVLVVEDQTLPRQLFENIVNSSASYELVGSIDSCDMADLYCAKTNPDLIITDIVMYDGINGIEMTKRIKKTYPGIKILMVTSMPDSTFLEKAKEVGADSFWYKEAQEEPMLEIMDRTMAGESVYPTVSPSVVIGNAKSTEFTSREIDVLRMLVAGLSDREIAENLDISFHTVRFHLNSMLAKTGSTSRTDLAIRAARSGIVVPEV